MKKGDVVTINDGSYSRSLINRKLIHEVKHWHDEQFVIIEVDCEFPTTDEYQTMYQSTFNNTVIQAIDSGKVVFIEERFLELVLPKHSVIIDVVRYSGYGVGVSGEIIEISDKLYKEIKRVS
jgi:hypothetical protein